MVRIRNPGGGGLDRTQWAAIDDASEAFADGTIRITTRQGVQYHHVYGPKLAPLVRSLNRGYRDRATLGACGDVNRNVMCSPVEGLDPADGDRPADRELAEARLDRTQEANGVAFRPHDLGYPDHRRAGEAQREARGSHSEVPVLDPQS